MVDHWCIKNDKGQFNDDLQGIHDQPATNQSMLLSGRDMNMYEQNVSWICNSILSLGYRDLLVKKEKDHLRNFKVAINTLSQECQGKKNGNRLHVLDINYKDDTEDS